MVAHVKLGRVAGPTDRQLMKTAESDGPRNFDAGTGRFGRRSESANAHC